MVPPFDQGKHQLTCQFVWWSWHPRYPYWSRSCWKGETQEEAMKVRDSEGGSGLDLYHNKLIREDGGGFVEVLDEPCRRLEVWVKIAGLPRRETDAAPIEL